MDDQRLFVLNACNVHTRAQKILFYLPTDVPRNLRMKDSRQAVHFISVCSSACFYEYNTDQDVLMCTDRYEFFIVRFRGTCIWPRLTGIAGDLAGLGTAGFSRTPFSTLECCPFRVGANYCPNGTKTVTPRIPDFLCQMRVAIGTAYHAGRKQNRNSGSLVSFPPTDLD